MEVYIHIGFPRTGSKWFDAQVYGKLQNEEFSFNPPAIMKVIGGVISMYGVEVNNDTLRKAKDFIDNELKKSIAKKLLIHREGLSMDPWIQDYGNTHSVLKYIFPDAKIIVMMRYQVDWIVSLYKGSCQKQCYQEVKVFLNYSNDNFHPVIRKPFKRKEKGFGVRKNRLDINTVKFPELLKLYYDTFGKRDLKILFFEDFKKDENAVVDDICKYIGVSAPAIDSFAAIGKGPSAFTCKLMHLIYNGFGLYTPSFSNSQERDNRNFFARAYMSFAFKINQLIFPTDYDISEKRNLDKLFYYNWDMLKKDGLRGKLDQIYKEDNKKLLEFIQRKRIPDVYL